MEDVDTSAEKQELKDISLAIEYKELKLSAPGGVFVVPDVANLRLWHGVIFVRQGFYRDGIFKLRIELPPDYNGLGTWPKIFFTTPVYSPLVHPETGEFDLSFVMPQWDPKDSFMVRALTYVKKVFYSKSFPEGPLPNPEARQHFEDNQELFLENVKDCVDASIARAYEKGVPGAMHFTEHRPEHQAYWEKLKERMETTAAAAKDNKLDHTGAVADAIGTIQSDDNRA